MKKKAAKKPAGRGKKAKLQDLEPKSNPRGGSLSFAVVADGSVAPNPGTVNLPAVQNTFLKIRS